MIAVLGAPAARAAHTDAAQPTQSTVHWVARRPAPAAQAPPGSKTSKASGQLRWRTGAAAPPKLLTKPPATEPLTADNVLRRDADTDSSGPGDQPSDADTLRPDGSGLPVDERVDEPAEAPIRLTGAAAPRDPFAAPAEEAADGDLSADETADELADGPAMVDPEADDALPEFAQRTMDEAPSGEPLPADVQDEPFPARLPEPGDELLGEARLPERCPSPRDLKPINQITHRIAAEPGLFPQECVLSDEPFQPRNFSCIAFTWKASALCHKPLYFQQAKLERYGHTFGPVLTPVISGGHFFVSVLALPYKIGMNPPWECMYPLGWYRPGSCAPYSLGPVPISLRGAALQGVVTTGLWFLFP